eukprot:gnl/Chilomastix_caulleri/1863.p2 GENE.gnl/Chilomastix_caulleri/1863~~gnl/Chilomastix_caulleri/1863.p2  ORF type:complete len:98 (+),score=22.54 gnl/Chilomastix_caulleri/1863:195-488(+)
MKPSRPSVETAELEEMEGSEEVVAEAEKEKAKEVARTGKGAQKPTGTTKKSSNKAGGVNDEGEQGTAKGKDQGAPTSSVQAKGTKGGRGCKGCGTRK